MNRHQTRFWVGHLLAASGLILFVWPVIELGGIPPVVFSVAAIAVLSGAAYCLPKPYRVPLFITMGICLLASAVDIHRYCSLHRKIRREDAMRNLVDPVNLPYLAIGAAAPEIHGRDLAGEEMTLSQHRGKVVLLVFWATWCGPCMGAIPHEKELVERFEGRPFVVVGVNGDGSIDEALAAVEEYSIPWRSFRNGKDGQLSSQWGVQAWPAVYVIDDEGVIRHKNLHKRSLNEPLEQLVALAEARALGHTDQGHTE